VTQQLILADKCKEETPQKNYKRRVQSEIASSDSGLHNAAGRCKLSASSLNLNALHCREICLMVAGLLTRGQMRDSFACGECQLVEIFASWWERMDRVQCLLQQIWAWGSAFDNGWTHIDDKQRPTHQSTSTTDSIFRKNRRVCLSDVARKTGRTALPSKGRFTHSMPCPCRAHAVPLPCRAAKGLECVFPISFTQCGRV
jgi:hypothetical protein